MGGKEGGVHFHAGAEERGRRGEKEGEERTEKSKL